MDPYVIEDLQDDRSGQGSLVVRTDFADGAAWQVQADQLGNSVSPNLALANWDFWDFWDFADVPDAAPDGVFRGFDERPGPSGSADCAEPPPELRT